MAAVRRPGRAPIAPCTGRCDRPSLSERTGLDSAHRLTRRIERTQVPSRPAGRGPVRGRQQAVRRRHRGRRRRSRGPRRRVLLAARAVRFGQDHVPPADRGLRDADRGPCAAARRGRQPEGTVPARREHGVPGLRAVPAHVGRRQRRVRDDGEARAEVRTTRARRRSVGSRPARRDGEASSVGALRRPAPARRPRARAREPAARAAARRAARRARPEAAAGDADRAEEHAAGGRDHLPVRDARPGRGAHDERPHRGVQQRPYRAGRHAR